MAKRGRPLGSKGRKTLDKEAARALLRERVIASLGPLVDSQIANAQGIKYLVAREKKGGKFRRMSEVEAIVQLGQESDVEIIEVWEKDPSVQAFTDLMNRTIDKPIEQIQASVSVSVNIVDRLTAGRKRVAALVRDTTGSGPRLLMEGKDAK